MSFVELCAAVIYVRIHKRTDTLEELSKKLKHSIVILCERKKIPITCIIHNKCDEEY